ncbi:hypothetical protein Acor_44330 [Acrocarpospora corrugata]|uniref:DUF2975 domain-containing protein n=1 Tax=Acrocarpospora corrugata TaxID=35763 RepID=A0A5M3VZR6_9ACTN|nr:DUF2975 domain-containing protein [Acrocarpospora corrugata]GES02367.1 hypothetical protein Acor_44330 [Acrocarpospora corrugata]
MGWTELRTWSVRIWWAIFENLVYLAFALCVVYLAQAGWQAAGPPSDHASMQVPQLREWPLTNPQQIGPLRSTLEYSATISIDRPDRWQNLVLNTPLVVGALLTAIIVFLLWQIARTLRSGDPFVPANARRIFLMAGCVAGYGLLVEPLRTFVAVYMVDGTPAEGLIDTYWPFTAAPVGFALLLIGLGTIFRKGARLREDADGLV